MPKWMYVWVEVGPANPRCTDLVNGLIEKLGGGPQPDVVPHTTPDAINFHHAEIEAQDEGEAYTLGGRLVTRTPGTVFNDYVIPCNENP